MYCLIASKRLRKTKRRKCLKKKKGSKKKKQNKKKRKFTKKKFKKKKVTKKKNKDIKPTPYFTLTTTTLPSVNATVCCCRKQDGVCVGDEKVECCTHRVGVRYTIMKY